MNFRWRTCKNIVRVSRASLKPDPWHCHRHQHQHHHHQFTFSTRATCAFPFYVFWSFIKRQVRRLGRYYYVPDSDPDKCTLNRFWSIGKWLLFYRFIHSLQNLSRPTTLYCDNKSINWKFMIWISSLHVLPLLLHLLHSIYNKPDYLDCRLICCSSSSSVHGQSRWGFVFLRTYLKLCNWVICIAGPV